MTLPATIRVNAHLPFPALVQGTGPITIKKSNGIWQIGFAPTLATNLSPRAQRFTNATPIVVAANDSIITCRIPTPAACALPAAASRTGLPITFKDLGQASANPITLTPAGAETIDGAAILVLRNNYAYVTLVPFADGTNIGWMVL